MAKVKYEVIVYAKGNPETYVLSEEGLGNLLYAMRVDKGFVASERFDGDFSNMDFYYPGHVKSLKIREVHNMPDDNRHECVIGRLPTCSFKEFVNSMIHGSNKKEQS